MKVYIEQVLLTNFIIDFCIMLVVSMVIFSKPNYKHIALSSLFGSVTTLILPYLPNAILINILKILTSIIMLQILHIHKKQLIKAGLLMLTLSYVIGGAILSNFGTQQNGVYCMSNISLTYVFGCTFIFTFVSYKLVKWIKNKLTANSHIHNLLLVYNNNKISIKGFIDSGNALQDNNNPVSIINFDTFSKLTNISLQQYLTNDFTTLTRPHFISASTIAGSKKILVFTINELHLNNKIYKNILMGVSLNFDNTKEYKAILNSSFCFT